MFDERRTGNIQGILMDVTSSAGRVAAFCSVPGDLDRALMAIRSLDVAVEQLHDALKACKEARDNV